jgi:hypothetical protein
MDGTKRVAVAVRVRPVLRNGVSHAHAQERFELDAVTRLSDTMLRVEQKKQDEACRSSTFTFDHIFDQESTQLEVYEEAVVDLVDAALCGNNATILAYGQTGSGKTHTVLGDVKPNPLENDLLTHNSGLFLRVLSDLMEYKKRRSKDLHVIVGLSCVEIYNESIRDLLGGGPNEPPKPLRAVMVGDDVILPNLIVKEVTSLQAVFHEIQLAISRRQSRATESNASSSRSHCLFLIDILQQSSAAPPPTLAALDSVKSKYSDPNSTSPAQSPSTPMPPGEAGTKSSKRGAASVSPQPQAAGGDISSRPTTPTTCGSPATLLEAYDASNYPGTLIRLPGQPHPIFASKILLADLAGSEKIKNSGVSGDGFTEATSINSSLTALGNVVHSLYEGSSFVSYRTSNLTRLLKPTFSQPTSRVLLLAQCSPTQLTFEETVNTFHFANKVKAMKVVTTTGAESEKLQFEVLEAEKTQDALLADLKIFSCEHEILLALLRRKALSLRASKLAYDSKNFRKPYKDKERRLFLEANGVLQIAEAEKQAVQSKRKHDEEQRRVQHDELIAKEAQKSVEEYRSSVNELRAALAAELRGKLDVEFSLVHAEASFMSQTIVLEEDSARSALLSEFFSGLTGKIADAVKGGDLTIDRLQGELNSLRAVQAPPHSPTSPGHDAMEADDVEYANACWAHCSAKRFFVSLMHLRDLQARSLTAKLGSAELERFIAEKESASASAAGGK